MLLHNRRWISLGSEFVFSKWFTWFDGGRGHSTTATRSCSIALSRIVAVVVGCGRHRWSNAVTVIICVLLMLQLLFLFYIAIGVLNEFFVTSIVIINMMLIILSK